MKVAVIIPVYNRRNITIECLKQLTVYLTGCIDYDFIVIDDGSTDGTDQAISTQFPKAVLLKGDGNLWWTGAVEKGRCYAIEHNYTHFLLLNDDLNFSPDFFFKLVEVSKKHPDALIGAIKLDCADKQTILCSGYIVKGVCKQFVDPFTGQRIENVYDNILKLNALAGATLLVPMHAAKQIGPFNVKDFPHNWGDMEYTFRANTLGFECYTATQSIIYTESNPNYLRTAIHTTTRIQFLKTLFDDRKIAYGFVPMFKRAYLGKNLIMGTLCLFRTYAFLSKKIFYKLFIWGTFLDIKGGKSDPTSGTKS